HRDDGAAARAEQVLGQPLYVRTEGQMERVAAHGGIAEPGEHVTERVREVRVRTGEIVVHRPLEPGLRAREGRVADGRRGEARLRVAPEIERLPADSLALVRREDAVAVLPGDQAA